MVIRPETAADRDAIRQVNEAAFPGGPEADLVDALRASNAWLPELSLVAEDDGEVVGHALFSVVSLDSGPELLSLGPMGVVPKRQRTGIGTLLVRRGLEIAGRADYPLVAVLGHPEFYPRFGFQRRDHRGSRRHSTCPTKPGWHCGCPATSRRFGGS